MNDFDGRIDGGTNEWTDGWIDGWMDGWTNECMDGWMDRQTDGWTDRQKISSFFRTFSIVTNSDNRLYLLPTLVMRQYRREKFSFIDYLLHLDLGLKMIFSKGWSFMISNS